MNREDAERLTIEEWSAAANYLKCESVVLETQLTESHDWGWVFVFKSKQGETGEVPRSHCSVAFDKEADQIVPVGNRGAELAIQQYRRARKKLRRTN